MTARAWRRRCGKRCCSAACAPTRPHPARASAWRSSPISRVVWRIDRARSVFTRRLARDVASSRGLAESAIMPLLGGALQNEIDPLVFDRVGHARHGAGFCRRPLQAPGTCVAHHRRSARRSAEGRPVRRRNRRDADDDRHRQRGEGRNADCTSRCRRRSSTRVSIVWRSR